MSRTYSNEGASHYSVRSGNSWGLIDRLSPAFRAGFNGLDSL